MIPHPHRIRVGGDFLKDFKATLNEHVFVITSDANSAALLPLIYAVAIASFLRGLGIDATLDPVSP